MSDWEEFETQVNTGSNKPKMAWDDEDAEDDVKESWDSDEEAVVPEETKAPVKKNLTLKQKIAEKEALLKEQKKKKAALANRFLDGETEEEKFERVQKEAGVKKEQMDSGEGTAKKAPSKPVESLKPRTRAEFEEFRQLLTDLILEQSNVSGYATFLDQLARDLAQPMKDMDVRKAASSLTALANDKQRQQREALKNNKKTKGKVTKTAAPTPSSREYSTTYDDFDDFM
ncbi:eukaryotic translation initiation factor 3 subunit J [Sporodiniella umbellata]|nr:eukaryotic translation initiation factor 3 subunit J [Sporodiniella umbellata]